MNSRAEGGDDQFGDGNENSTDALVSDAEDLNHIRTTERKSFNTVSESTYLFAVANDNIVNVVASSKVRQSFIDAVLIVDIQKTSLGPTKQPRVVLNGIALGRRINDAEHFFQMRLKQLETSINPEFSPGQEIHSTFQDHPTL